MIPCYTIHHLVESGIDVAGPSAPRPGYIEVGERGRGRKVALVPPPPGAQIERCRLVACSVSDPQAAAVLLVRDQSGFRGSWYLASAPSGLCPGDAGRTCDGDCRQAHLVGMRRIAPSEIGRVIAAGECAQGDAGHMGGGPEYLIVARPGQFSLVRRGRLYGEPPIVVVTVKADGKVHLCNPWALFETEAAAAAW